MNTPSHSQRILPAFFCLLLLSACGNKVVAESDRIRLLEPKENVILTSPFVLRGEARTFENTVRFRVKDSAGTVLADSFTTATGDLGEFGPFEAEVTFDIPTTKEGIIEIFEESAEDGSVVGKVEIPVKF